jgi:phage terminase large subunit
MRRRGFGQKYFAGRKVLERIDGEAGHRILVCRKIARTLRESCFRQLSGQIKEHYDVRDFKINRTDMLITNLKNGSSILFAGLDDAEKLKSVYRVTGIWIEEGSEITEADYNQLDLRLRAGRNRINNHHDV